MVEQVTFQTVFQFLQTVGILVGVFYYVMTIRANQRNQEITLKNQQLSSVHRILEVYNDPEAYSKWNEVLNLKWEDYDDFRRRYGNNQDPEMEAKYGTMFQYYDGIGYLWKEGVLDIQSLSVYLGWGCLLLWWRYKPVVEGTREYYLDYCLYWEQLAETLEEVMGDRINSPRD